MYNNVEADDIDTTTAFGEITYDEIEFSMDYPLNLMESSIIMHIIFMTV